jgi:arylsulfatase A-like enzyme
MERPSADACFDSGEGQQIASVQAFLAQAGGGFTIARSAVMATRPNVLLIITDHEAYYGHDQIGEFTYTWPNYEAFCDQGVRFERAYSVSPICSPARASMMTGLYPSAHGLMWNTEATQSFNRIEFEPGQLLYSHYLSQAGYRNAYVGKWHCGHERLPIDYGIEGWALPDYGKVYMSDAYRSYASERGLGDATVLVEYNMDHPEWDGQRLVLHHPSPWRFMNGCGVLQGPPEAHEEFFVAHLAVTKLHELAQSDQPFSLVASFWGPHQPYFPTEPFASIFDPESIPEYPSFYDDLAGRPLRYLTHCELSHPSAAAWPDWATWQRILARCYGQGLQTDAAVGQILQCLEDLGLAENTLVIWVADHGDAVASHGRLWDKASTFTEEVARVRLALRWPQGIEGGQCIEWLVSNMDVTATMLDAAGVTVPQRLHSRSLLPLCADAAPVDWPDQIICEHHGHGHILPQRIVVCGPYKYVAALFDGDELYDLDADPWEMVNLIDDPAYAAVRADLRARLVAHIEAHLDEGSWFVRRSMQSLLVALTHDR